MKKMAISSAAAILRAASNFIARQGLKAGASTPSFLPSLYAPKFGMPQTETFLTGAAKAFKTLANQTYNPFSMRSAEAFKNTGLASVSYTHLTLPTTPYV